MQELIGIYTQNQTLFNGIITILGVTGVLGALKKVIAKDLSNKTLAVLLTALSTAGAFIDWFLTNFSGSDTSFGLHTAAIIGAAHVVYNLLVKPTTNLVKDIQVEKQNQAVSNQASIGATVPQITNPTIVDA